jgi:uncharacterized protein HemY
LFKYILAIFGLAFAGLIGFLAHYQPGHLLLVYQQKNLEIPLWLALLLNLGVICLILLVHAFFSSLYRGYRWIGHALQNHRRQHALEEQKALSVYLQQLSTLSQSNTSTLEILQSTWASAHKSFRYHPEALLLYIDTLRKKGLAPMAENVLSQALDKYWYDSWVHLYGLIPSPDANTQLKKAERWLSSNKHTSSATLLLTLGRLSLRNRLWGKAKQYLEQSIAISPSAEGYAELGRLHEFLGDFTIGESCYKQGILALVSQDFVIYPPAMSSMPKPPSQSFFNRLMGKSAKATTQIHQNIRAETPLL